jgi:hypothetical protein
MSIYKSLCQRNKYIREGKYRIIPNPSLTRPNLSFWLKCKYTSHLSSHRQLPLTFFVVYRVNNRIIKYKEQAQYNFFWASTL